MFVADFRKKRVKITNKFEFLKVVCHMMNIFEGNAIKSDFHHMHQLFFNFLSFYAFFRCFQGKPPKIRQHICWADF
jgi:hypothetical protein